MARERDDEFEDDELEDDRPRRRRRDRDDEDDAPRRGDARAGRDKVKTPGLFLALAGALTLAFGVALVALTVAAPGTLTDPMYDFLIEMTQKQPANPGQAGLIAQYEQAKIDARTVNPVNVATSLLGVVLSALALVGGLQMRAGKGYGLAMTGAICAIVPLTSCCCVTMPAGIWALVVLLNADVKAAFAASKVGGTDLEYRG